VNLFESIVKDVSRACERANLRFDHAKFEKACGLAAIENRRSPEMRFARAA
jgi:hypothetical protein